MKIKGLLILIAILALLVLAIFIGSFNSHLVTMHYLIAQTELKLSYLLVTTLLSGVVIAVLFILPYLLRLKWQITRLNRKNRKLLQRTSDP